MHHRNHYFYFTMEETKPREGKQCTQRLTASQWGRVLFFKVVLFPPGSSSKYGKEGTTFIHSTVILRKDSSTLPLNNP